jgi:carbon-monoxide dehydrogenase large subunit
MHASDSRVACGSIIGQGVERLEDLRLLRGEGRFVDDVTLPGMLHAAVLRSPIAHGRIIGIDASRARAMPGVHAVIDAATILAIRGAPVPAIPLRQEPLPQLVPFHQPVIAEGKVRYVGEPLALVVADTQALAEDALEEIEVDIEPLAPIAGRGQAEANEILLFEDQGSNLVLALYAERGESEAAFATAPYRRREQFTVHRHTAVPMETRGVVAEFDVEREHLTVYGAAKVPFATRRMLAERMDLPQECVDVIECDVGGAFGVRGEFYPEDFLIPFAARMLGRPVKWIEDRREHLLATNHARDAECEIEIACDLDGNILGLRGHAKVDVGAYVRNAGITPSRNIAQVSPGPYRIPHVRMDVSVFVTNKTPVGTYRGPGRFETDFFRERMIDLAAIDLGIDRVEIRRRNLVARHEIPYAMPKVQPFDSGTSTDSGDYAAALQRCLDEFDWQSRARLDGQFIEGCYHGIAVGCYIEGGASGPGENAQLRLRGDGSVDVCVGSSGVGQGLETVHAQIAADALGVPLATIRSVAHGSTTVVKQGYGSYSSRSTVMGGSAIVDAATKLQLSIREAAALRFGCAVDEVEIVGMREVRGPGERRASIPELATGPFLADGSFQSTKRTYSYGTHAAYVTVDPGTGQVTVVDYVAVEDVGRIVNPHTLHGQTIGAIVQGLGGVLLEALHYDEESQLLTGSLADYMLPTSTEFPSIRVVALEEHPSPHNPLGAKGAGEGGIIPVGGLIANAVGSALRSTGVNPRSLPLTPPRVWQLLRERTVA